MALSVSRGPSMILAASLFTVALSPSANVQAATVASDVIHISASRGQPAVCRTVACWRTAHSQSVTLRTGGTSTRALGPGVARRLRVTPTVRGTLVSADAGNPQTISTRVIKGMRPIRGLPARGVKGLVIVPSSATAASLSLRFRVGPGVRRATVLAAKADGTDLHRLPVWGRKVDVPVTEPMAIMVIPEAAGLRWIRAGVRTHMPASPLLKLEHALAYVTGARKTRGGATLAAHASSNNNVSRVASVLGQYREYLTWLRAKHANNPAKSVEDVSRVWTGVLHHEAVAAELGLVDPDDLEQDRQEWRDHLTASINAWLGQLAQPCVRQSDVSNVLKILRHAELSGVKPDRSLNDLPGCPYRITGHITVASIQDLMSDRANGGHNIIESNAELEVRILAQGLLGFGANPALATVVDEGTAVEFTGQSAYRSRSDTGTCDELIADNYRSIETVFGPYAGPVDSIEASTGDTGRFVLSAGWRYVAHETTMTLVPDPSGCDHRFVDQDIARTEEVVAVGVVSQSGTDFTFDNQPDPFTKVTGKLRAQEVVQ